MIVVDDSTLGSIGLEIVKANTKNTAKADNGSIIFQSDIRLELMLNEIEKGISSPVDEEAVTRMEKQIEDKVKRMAFSAVKKCYENGSDPLMTAHYLAANEEADYRKYQDNWRSRLKDIDVRVRVYANIQRVNDNTAPKV